MEKQKRFFNVTLTYFIAMFAFIALRIVFASGLLNFSNEYINESVSTFIIQVLIMGSIPFFVYSFLNKKNTFGKVSFKQTFSDFGFKKISFKTIIIALLLGICVYIFNIFVASFFDSIIANFGYEKASSSIAGGVKYDSIASLLFGLVTVGIFPAVFEEIAHRGLILSAGKKAIGAKGAILLSGFFFGLMHLNVNQFFYATLIGIFIAFVAYVSKSIFPAMIIHFVNNAINVYFSYASNTGSVGSDWFNNVNKFLSSGNTLLIMLTVVITVIILTAITIMLVILLHNDNNKQNAFCFRLLTPESVVKYQQNKKVVSQVMQYKIENEKQELTNNNEVVIPEDADLVKTFFPEKFEKVKFDFQQKIFLYAVIIMGVLTTLATFIWGVL